MLLNRRIQRLEAALPKRLPPIPGIAPRWQSIARTKPEAKRRALLFAERARLLSQGHPFNDDALLRDDECFDHYIWLECNRLGSLDEWFGRFLDGETQRR